MYLTSFLDKILPIIYALFGFCALIVIHELGHFLFCKLFGIHTPTFSIGIGPKIIEKKIGTTNFRISAIPLGGYCEIAGNIELGQGEQEYSHVNDETAFRTKSYWKKFLVLMGGIFFNIIFAYLAFITLFLIGKPKTDQVVIKTVFENSLAQQSGLKSGDRILKMGDSDINQKATLLFKEIQNIQNASDQEYSITILRDQKEETIKIKLPSTDSQSQTQSKGKLGIQFDFLPSGEIEKYPLKEAIVKGFNHTNEWIMFTILAIKNLFSHKALNGAGPVMIISESVKKAQQGFSFLLIFLAIISINLAIFNLLPLPVLDGGQLLLVTIESLIGRELSTNFKIGIFIVSWIILLSALILFTYNDIKTLLGF